MNDSMVSPTFKPLKVPALKLRLSGVKVLRSSNRLLALLRNGESEVRVWLSNTGLRAVDRRVDLETDIKE